MTVHEVNLGNVVFGKPDRLVLIGGPCVIESEDSTLRHAENILKITREFDFPYVFKASYDKANRSSGKSFRGPGIEDGLKILAKVKKELGIPVLSDVHAVDEINQAADVLDILQIPAFLCRQTDLLFAAAKTQKVVNVKKGQFLSPWETENIVKKLKEAGTEKILLTERGTTFGYNNLINDFKGIPIMRGFGYPVVFDATHSVQLPGGQGASSGGMSEFIPTLAKCGVVAGADAVFMEIHESPEKALSDGPNALALERLKPLLSVLKDLKEVVSRDEVLSL